MTFPFFHYYMTLSPMSMWGVKVGLFLPRRMAAAWLARRPSTTSAASMMTQPRLTSEILGVYVRVTVLPLHFEVSGS